MAVTDEQRWNGYVKMSGTKGWKSYAKEHGERVVVPAMKRVLTGDPRKLSDMTEEMKLLVGKEWLNELAGKAQAKVADAELESFLANKKVETTTVQDQGNPEDEEDGLAKKRKRKREDETAKEDSRTKKSRNEAGPAGKAPEKPGGAYHAVGGGKEKDAEVKIMDEEKEFDMFLDQVSSHLAKLEACVEALKDKHREIDMTDVDNRVATMTQLVTDVQEDRADK